ncbi:arogenate or prephenate dehydrogenase family protein [Klebsormidium nitens]|uniref:Arogenate or prephenate dehydrogenase family protein n=1 Tax=Klebsormidium nitens TaxID=105231 RepID=A0A1Y1HLV6_KLENI|nr:arogenate or prephenate dehydrogenase family protein [Klebsormidium nitens]|eukprot:GAQ79610.1 arogenate or prephenate dehydrogenase family protein [Klebsormidium nitens]
MSTSQKISSSSSLGNPSVFSPSNNQRQLPRKGGLIRALDAAMPFDYESKKQRELREKSKLLIGVVGFGNFGQFIAKRMIQHGHTVLGYSRGDYSKVAEDMGARYFRDIDDFCEEHPDVVIICTSILSTERVLRAVPFQRLRRSTLFVDMLSVKEFPKALFQQLLPKDFDLLCTHPMFGPESGKGAWTGLPFVYDKVRVGKNHARQDRCERFLKVFEQEGCRMVEMTCEEHDKYAASSQFITHTVGRVLGQLALESTPINTKGYETLLSLVDNTCKDSFDLYYGLFMYNINATEELERLERSFDAVKKQLFDQLHDILRTQLFQSTPAKRAPQELPQIASTPRPLLLPATSSNGGASNGVSSNGSASNGAAGPHLSKEDGVVKVSE